MEIIYTKIPQKELEQEMFDPSPEVAQYPRESMIFVFPTQAESEIFSRHNPHAHIEICGVGAAECAASVSRIVEQYGRDKLLILCGIAGSYDTFKCPVGSVWEVSAESIEELPERFRCRYPFSARFNLGQAMSNSANIANTNYLGEALIENMEGAAFAAMCRALGVECSQIRAISNRVGEPFERWNLPLAFKALSDSLSAIYNKYGI